MPGHLSEVDDPFKCAGVFQGTFSTEDLIGLILMKDS